MSTCSGVQSDSPSSDLTLVDLREAIRWSIPSAFTLSSLLAGLSAVRFASEADFNSSIVCVLLAAIFDGLDGHVARYLGACSKIGFELDTLCDLANFGVTPAFVVFFWAKTPPAVECNHGKCPRENAVLWLACLCYAACCAFRLARFNVAGHAAEMDKQHLESRPGQRPPVQKAMLHNFRQRKLYFQGIPAPVAAMYALTPLMLQFCQGASAAESREPGPAAMRRTGATCTLLFTAALMVSPLPTFSSKMLKIDRDDTHLRSRYFSSFAAKVVFGLLLAGLLWLYPFWVILVCNVLHLVSIPVSLVVYNLVGIDKSD
mmetsp:Transcript_122567/g.381549  ORF Transcript_122567/g.381549 Transcript_122567/m.381549 type:complete len:317 (+) Transcript_122567:113-1063(+)|eukprot:CAMPEP_0204565520 /NCGR_PEP_ID=MMETSP0661-20131031/35518_1 /ASSEMBLY_ACC=CAM_ASM_000606 /TAXON_ID=109239 /ORGANISM="Alexandrium margalefi, Strain AMGDE01CS-322" /LENGTH=316 /DNA_ID=CAMNT_0051573273 /DNA_START=113 /DNA_END=1063 /DNA_ORIENTATION=+